LAGFAGSSGKANYGSIMENRGTGCPCGTSIWDDFDSFPLAVSTNTERQKGVLKCL
jgi:hypothetical protein